MDWAVLCGWELVFGGLEACRGGCRGCVRGVQCRVQRECSWELELGGQGQGMAKGVTDFGQSRTERCGQGMGDGNEDDGGLQTTAREEVKGS